MAYTNGNPIRKMLVDEVIHPVHDYRILPKDYRLAELTQSLNQDFDADSLAILNDASPETVFFVNDGGKHIVCSPTNTKEIQADGTIIPWVSTIDEKGEAFGIKCVFEDNTITSAKLIKMDSPYVKVAKGYMEVRTNQNPIKLTTQVMKPVEVGDTILGFEYIEEETECTLPPIEPIVHYPKSLLFTSPTPFTITTAQTETETPGWYGDGDLEVGVNGVDFTDITEINTPFTIESEFNFDLGSHALFIRGVGNSTLNNTKFKCSGNNVVLQGYLSAVLDWTEEATTIGEGAYVGVFSGSSAYTDCSGLIMPSVLSEGALAGAFSGCSNLTIAPDLPAVELYEECYAEMFSGCTSLIKPPKLKAVTLEPYCYSGMFSECANLIMPPTLPATTLAEGCYAGMFLGCTSLTTSPKLSAETLEPLCYQSMFDGCASLINVNSFTPTTMAQSACSSMFAGCSKLTSFPDLTCTSLAKACYAGMFQECTSLMIVPALPAATLAVECYNEMFKGCTSIGTPAALPATSYPEGCYQSMFEGCTGIVWQSGTKGTSYRIPVTGTGDAPGTNAFTDMFKGNTFVSGAGMPESGIPTVNTDYYYSDFVIFKGEEPFALTLSSQFIYSVDDGVNWTVGYDEAIPSNANNEIWVKHNPAATYNRFRFANNTTITITGDKVGIDGKLVDLVGPEIQCAYLFEGQTGLTDISKLIFPSYTRPQCYMGMFKGTSVDMPATLPATQLAINCYVSMFEDCVGISWSDKGQEYTVGVIGGDQGAVKNMFKGCSTTPTSTMPADGTPVLGETYYIEQKSLIFACTSNFTLKIYKDYGSTLGTGSDGIIEYSTPDTNGGWVNIAQVGYTLNSVKDPSDNMYYIYLRGVGGTTLAANGITNIRTKTMINEIKIIGEITTLLDYKTNYADGQGVFGEKTFKGLFDNFNPTMNTIINCSELDLMTNHTPADNMYYLLFERTFIKNLNFTGYSGTVPVGYCGYMFSSCSLSNCNIELPSVSLSESCYDSMFTGAKPSSSNLPTELPALIVSKSAYRSMFAKSNITSFPVIKCAEIKENGCGYMFNECSQVEGTLDNIFTNDNIPIGTEGCRNMFYKCTKIDNLMNIKQKFSTIDNYGLMRFYYGCTNIKCEVPEDYFPDTSRSYAFAEMFYGTGVTKVNSFTTNDSSGRYVFNNTFASCKQLTEVGDITINKAWTYMFTGSYGSGGTFEDCTALTKVGDITLTATTNLENTFAQMFLKCKALTEVGTITIKTTSSDCQCKSMFSRTFESCIALANAPIIKFEGKFTTGYTGDTTQMFNSTFNKTAITTGLDITSDDCAYVEYNCGRYGNPYPNTQLQIICPGGDNEITIPKDMDLPQFIGITTINYIPSINCNNHAVSIKYMFQNCTQIKWVNETYPGAIPFRIYNHKNGWFNATNMFEGCTFDATSTLDSTTGTPEPNVTYYYVIE